MIEILLSNNLIRRKEQLKMVTNYIKSPTLTLPSPPLSLSKELDDIALTDNDQQVSLLSSDLQQLSVKIDHTKSRMDGKRS